MTGNRRFITLRCPRCTARIVSDMPDRADVWLARHIADRHPRGIVRRVRDAAQQYGWPVVTLPLSIAGYLALVAWAVR